MRFRKIPGNPCSRCCCFFAEAIYGTIFAGGTIFTPSANVAVSRYSSFVDGNAVDASANSVSWCAPLAFDPPMAMLGILRTTPGFASVAPVATASAAPGMPEPEQEFDLWPCLESAVGKVTRSAEFDGLAVTLDGDRAPAPVRGVPQPLEDLLSAVLQLLAYDAKLPGEIVVRVSRADGKLELKLRNTGFGMPNERLQAMLEGPIWPQSPTLRRIRQLFGTSLGTDGTLSLSSSVGAGYEAVLTIPLIV